MLQTEQVLGERYQLQRQLGNNAGRQTWLATDIKASPAKPVIVKLLAFSPQMQWEEFKLFEREAQVLKNLDHSRLPKYRDYFSLDRDRGEGLCWFALVQDYIPGQSLQQLLDEGKRFTEEQVRSIATQVLKILIYLHRLNPPILHRDIKPNNLIWGEDEQVYLVDFGAVADPTAVEGATFTVVGTAGYAPLEQFYGKAVPASDLYALGATLIHLLTGTSPADLPQSNLRIQFQGQVSVAPSLVRWVETLTKPDLGRRFNSAKQAFNALHSGHSLNSSYQKVSFSTSRVQLRQSPSQLTIKIPRQRRYLEGLIELGEVLIWVVCLLAFLLGQSFCLALVLGLSMFALTCLSNVLTMASIRNIGDILMSILMISIFLLIPILILCALWIFLNYRGLLIVKNIIKLTAEFQRIVLTALGESFLSFTENKFVLEKRFLGLCYRRVQGKTTDIRNLKVIPHQGVAICTKGKKYKFGRFLTEIECNGLVQEIQNWLY